MSTLTSDLFAFEAIVAEDRGLDEIPTSRAKGSARSGAPCVYRLFMFLAAVFTATMRRCGMSLSMSAVGVCRTWAPSTIRRIPSPTTAGDVASTAASSEAILTPAMAVAPVRPRAHAQKDAVVEISRPVKAAGRASVRRILVVAVGTTRWSQADHNLCLGRWHQGQRRQQGCTRQKQTAFREFADLEFANPEFADPGARALDLPHKLLSLPNLRVRIESGI